MLRQVIRDDSFKKRLNVSKFCQSLLSDKVGEFVKADEVFQRMVQELGVMEKVFGSKEPRVLHMKISEVKLVLDELLN